ncbi:DNA recombination protein RmuC [Candidatus Woesebacteria bacterium]|nr:DNA recombination protein RmuC [Candidatus Woesebacteria bacterium]
MSFEVGVIFLIAIGFIGLYFALRHLLQQRSQTDSIESIVEQVFGRSASLVAQQSRDILKGEKELIASNLSHQHRSIQTMVDVIKVDLEKRQDEIRGLEQDRVKKFSELTTALESHRKVAEEVAISSKKLAEVLSNNQARGEWGERIIEDLLKANGLMEGVHYERQTPLENTSLRPDITLLLPDKRFVCVDVKFPFSDVQKLALSDSKSQQQTLLVQFARNLRDKIDKVALYINPGARTLDYAILFVPNEMIFSFVNQKLPDVVDYAFKKRVLLVSPFTFLMVARTVLESYRNFMISDSLRDAVIQIDEFVGEWEKFREQFEKYGRTLKTLQSDYEQLTGTRVRQMEKKIEKIEGIRKGSSLQSSEETSLLG